MKLKDIIGAIEKVAPLSIQDGFDNSGLQVGIPEQEVSSVLICLDVTEDVVAEAERLGCQLIISHHPLLFHPLRTVSDTTYQQRCVIRAVTSGIAIYSAHTSLDNARGGVNFKIAEKIGLDGLCWLSAREDADAGSGVIGELRAPMAERDFLLMLKDKFGVRCLKHSATTGKMIKRVAVCGGAGAFLLPDAIRREADCFVCGEFHYHDWFENSGVTLAELGHYESEQFTQELLLELLSSAFPGIDARITATHTNPINCL